MLDFMKGNNLCARACSRSNDPAVLLRFCYCSSLRTTFDHFFVERAITKASSICRGSFVGVHRDASDRVSLWEYWAKLSFSKSLSNLCIHPNSFLGSHGRVYPLEAATLEMRQESLC